MSNDVCDTLSSQSTCDANPSCTWCISAAVKPGCKNVDDAKKLPPSIFKCDAKNEVKPVMQPNPFSLQDGACSAFTSQSTCDANADCTWCRSAAVKSSCQTLEDAQKLPPSIFACDAKNDEAAMPKKALMFPKFDFPWDKPEQKSSHHGKHDGKKHHIPCPVPFILAVVFAFHFYYLSKFRKSQEDFEAAGGKLVPKFGRWRCPNKQVEPQPQQTSNVVNYSIVDHDKEFPEVTAPTVNYTI